ncbi:MAG: hypothetical protein R2932_22790 [Caldilineaceae bacterium]
MSTRPLHREIPDYATVLRLICQELGHEPDEALLATLQAERFVLKRGPFMAIDPQVSALLTTLAQQEIPVAVLQQCRTGRSGSVAGIAAGCAHPHNCFLL